MGIIESSSGSFNMLGIEKSGDLVALDGISFIVVGPVSNVEIPDMNVKALLTTENNVHIRVILTDFLTNSYSCVLGHSQAAHTYAVFPYEVFVRLLKEIKVYIDDVFSTDRVRSWCLSLTAYPIGHQPVQHGHIDVLRREIDTEPFQRLEVKSVLKPIQLHEGIIKGSDLELLRPETGPRPMNNILLEAA